MSKSLRILMLEDRPVASGLAADQLSEADISFIAQQAVNIHRAIDDGMFWTTMVLVVQCMREQLMLKLSMRFVLSDAFTNRFPATPAEQTRNGHDERES